MIGIDQIDDIRSAGTAVAILDDIKAIFDIPHCLYLMSVSDDIIARFGQFDEVFRVDYLDFEAAREM